MCLAVATAATPRVQKSAVADPAVVPALGAINDADLAAAAPPQASISPIDPKVA